MAQSHSKILDTIKKESKTTAASKTTVIFGHHPCPDGITALVCLAEKFKFETTSYHGLNHGALEEMRKTIFSAIDANISHVIFADIIPSFTLLKEVLEKTTCNITLLDHHATAKNEMDVLFIEADIQTGRTFDALIAAKLATFSRPTIAMIANTNTISDKNNWVALRAANNQYNLFEIASLYKNKKLASNAGGHPRASALQLDRNQLTAFTHLIVKPAPSLTLTNQLK